MKKLILLFLLFSLCLASVSCSRSENELKAELLNGDLTPDCFNESFIEENRTYGAYYDGTFFEEEGVPRSRVIIIKTENEFNSAFADAPEEISIDFSKESLIIYAFTTEYHREVTLKSFQKIDGALTVEYKMKSTSGLFNVGDAAMPFERFVAVKINSQDIATAEFVEVKGY